MRTVCVSPDGWRSCGGDNRPGGMDRASLFKKQNKTKVAKLVCSTVAVL